MNIVYLKDGTKCNLIEKTTRGYVVEQIYSYSGIETQNPDEFFEEPAGPTFFVDKVYTEAPIMVINDQIRQLQEVENALNRSIADKKQELSGLTRTIELTKKTVTDAGKMIFNRSEIQNAKRLIVWIDGYISPRVMDVKKNLKLTISYTISQWGDMTEKCWSQSCWNDADGSERWSGYNEYFDPKYGIKFDLSDEQIMEITYERQRNFRFDENKIAITPDEYLTIDNLQRKREYEANKKVRTIEQAKKDLEKAQEQYTKLIAETVVS